MGSKQQVREAVIELLRNEQYTAGRYIPSEQELVERFDASRATVREALKGLVQAGLLDCRHGKGYFVLSREAVIHKPITHLQSVTDLMADMGYTVENRVLRVCEEMPSPQVRRELQLDNTQSILRLERVRCSRNEPLISSIDLFSRTLIPGPWQEQDWSGSLLNLFDEGCQVHIASSRTTIRATTLPAELCAEIGVPNTYIATVFAITYVGATPVFVDVEPDTYNISPDLLEAAITERTRAIIPVHLYGQPCEMEQVLVIAHKHGL